MNKRIKELAEEAGFPVYDKHYAYIEGECIEKFAKLVAADEREACIEICLKYRDEKAEKHIGKMIVSMIANYPELYGMIQGANSCAFLIKQRDDIEEDFGVKE
jgi:hypothetical protein